MNVKELKDIFFKKKKKTKLPDDFEIQILLELESDAPPAWQYQVPALRCAVSNRSKALIFCHEEYDLNHFSKKRRQ